VGLSEIRKSCWNLLDSNKIDGKLIINASLLSENI